MSLRALRPHRTARTRRSRGRCSSTSSRARSTRNEDIRNFVKFMLDNNQSIAEAAQFVPLSEDQIARGADEARGRNELVSSRDVVLGQPAPFELPRKRIRWGEQFVHVVLFIAAAISILTTLGIVISLLLPAIDFFREVSPWEFLTGTTWTPLFLDGQFGVVPLVVGTIMISFLSAVVAFPLGLGVAIYLSEYAQSTRLQRPEADSRDPRGDPDRRPRVLRAHVRDAAPPRYRAPGRDLQRALGEPRARGHAHPDDRVALRGRYGRGPA